MKKWCAEAGPWAQVLPNCTEVVAERKLGEEAGGRVGPCNVWGLQRVRLDEMAKDLPKTCVWFLGQ